MTRHGYMASLRRKVEAYEQTGVFPAYMIFLDQNYYEANKGKTFLGLLADPLGAPFTLPGKDSLSAAMQAGAACQPGQPARRGGQLAACSRPRRRATPTRGVAPADDPRPREHHQSLGSLVPLQPPARLCRSRPTT